MSNIKHNVSENSVAEKAFKPELDEVHNNLFANLVERIGAALPTNKQAIIKEEISEYKKQNPNYLSNLESLKYIASLSILLDLSLQGWIFDVSGTSLTLRMESDNFGSKEKIRNRLRLETDAQFRVSSVKAFVKKMEKPKAFNGNTISVKDLFGNPEILIENITSQRCVCAPYIQLVSDEYDIHTGYRLSEIWKYFRYTWSIPYKTMPGRNMYYLVRDSKQPFHPVMGIFALGNSVLNLTVRDNDIGWSIEAIKQTIDRQTTTANYEQCVAKTNGAKVKVSYKRNDETENEFAERSSKYASTLLALLINNVNAAIADLYIEDLGEEAKSDNPSDDYILWLQSESERIRKISLNNKNQKNPDWISEAKSNLFTRKRTAELAKLLSAKKKLLSEPGVSDYERVKHLLANAEGRKAITVALVANRKCKIGSNMMDIIVCGSIPPYNELLGGKLVSILSCSPTVIRDYTLKYQEQVSEIASRMKGEKIVRDSHLAYLGTTSLYAIGSSQYNRIKVPLSNGGTLAFREMGITVGYGTVFFSSDTTSILSKMLEKIDGGKRISHVFGEGTSPRFRLINRGLTVLGIHAPSFLNHYSPRIVYSVNLAKNTNEFLLGVEDKLDYNFDITSDQDVQDKTQELIDYWYKRWMEKRLTTVDIIERLNSFDIQEYLLSNRIL